MYVGSASRLLSSSSKFMKKEKKTATQAFRVVASMHCSWLGYYGNSRTERCVHACIPSSTISHASSNTQDLMYCLHHKLHTLAAGSFWKRRRQQNVEALPKLCAVPIHSLAKTAASEGPGRLRGVARFFDDLPLNGSKLSGGDDWCGMAATLDLALIGALEGGADGDDPAGARYF